MYKCTYFLGRAYFYRCKNDLLTNNNTSYNNIQSQVYQQRNVTIIITVRSLRRSRYNIIILRPPRFRRCASTSID
jgi:hypothetical protein